MNKKSKIALFITVGCCLFVSALGLSKSITSGGLTDLEMRIDIADRVYSLGEIVPINISIVNRSSESVILSDEAIQEISIRISPDTTSNFKDYVGPDRGFTLDGRFPDIKIGPKSSFEMLSSIYWNRTPKLTHLSSEDANRISKNRILDDFAFGRPGVYYVKTVLVLRTSKDFVKTIESAPIVINIEEPVGENLRLWNLIKHKPEIAYFIQTGEKPKSAKVQSDENFIREIEGIGFAYPESSIAAQIKQSLQKFRDANEKVSPKE